MKPVAHALVALLLGAGGVGASSLVDPAFLEQYAATYRFRLGSPASITGTPDGKGVYFLRSGPRSFVRDLYFLDLATGEEEVVLTASDLLGGAREELTPEEKARRERQRLVAKGFASFELSRDGARLLVPLSGKLWVVETATGKARQLPDEGGPALDAHFSPDGARVACIRDHDLWVIDVAAGTQRRLTTRAGDHERFGEAEFVAQEEMGRYRGYWWAPDSRRLLVQRTDTSPVETWRIADPLDPGQTPDPWPYPRPGKANARVGLAIHAVDGSSELRPVTWDHEAFEYLAHVTWPDAGPLTIVVQDRRQRSSLALAVDPASGTTRELVREQDPAWVNLHGDNPTWLPGGERFLWVSEAGGWKSLELRSADGSLQRVVAGRKQGFDGLARVLPDGETALITLRPDQTQRRLAWVSLGSPGKPRLLEPGEGVQFARHHEHSPLTAVSGYPRSGGKRLRIHRGTEPLAAAPRDVAESPPFQARCEWLRVGTGDGRELPAVIVRPRKLDAGKKYPVLLDVYGGPGVSTVSASPRWYTLAQWIADQGFVVVSLDGRGTPGRGRDWERATYRDLIAAPLADQTRAIQSLCERFPELDGRRIGVFGWSFGGYFSAMAVLRHPEVYRAGVAGAPVVDWADYDTHYTERYMDLPAENPEGYEAANVLTYADRLARPLLLIHGTGDDNVYFMHSLKLADALFRAGKDYDFLPLVGFTHMVPDPDVLKSLWGRIVGHFRRHLGRPRPRDG